MVDVSTMGECDEMYWTTRVSSWALAVSGPSTTRSVYTLHASSAKHSALVHTRNFARTLLFTLFDVDGSFRCGKAAC